ncbi:MAG: 6-bladed beta-propeller [Candidatus Aminicenantes bacterium]|nr:6-bladed beta-propeller [Candidatus Aminicenantes bacterium]
MTQKIHFLLVFIVVILLALICLPKETTTYENTSIQKSEDVVVISNPKTPAHKMRIVFQEELTIGEFEGDENYMFGGSIYFNTDDEGNFYVVDADNHRIQKYDPEGKYILTIGREGQGPGEFRSFSLPRFDKDNRLYITDGSNRRISFFDKDGQYLKQIRMQERYENLHINSKGFIVANKWQMAQEGNAQKQTHLYGLFDSEFNQVQELFKDEIETPLPTGRDASSLGDFIARTFSILAFRPQVIITLANNDFIYLGFPDKYEIIVYSPEGKPARKITRDYDPLPVNEKDKESFLKIVSEQALSLPIFTDDIKKIALQKIKYPKYKPAYQSFTLMENGWLAVIVDSVKDEYTLIDIFDQEGKYITQFKTSVPAEGILSALLFFKNGKAYTVVTEDEYWLVKRYSIELQEFKGNEWVKSSIKLR